VYYSARRVDELSKITEFLGHEKFRAQPSKQAASKYSILPTPEQITSGASSRIHVATVHNYKWRQLLVTSRHTLTPLASAPQ
jgi:hypothetical protein